MMNELTVVPPCFAMSTNFAAFPDTITSPGLEMGVHSRIHRSRGCNFHDCQNGTFAPRNPIHPVHQISLSCGTGEDELLQERKPLLERPSSAQRSSSRISCSSSSNSGWSSGAILFVNEMSSELGVRDLACRFLFRNVHRKGAMSAPNSVRETTCLRWEGLCGSVSLDRAFAGFFPWHFRVRDFIRRTLGDISILCSGSTCSCTEGTPIHCFLVGGMTCTLPFSELRRCLTSRRRSKPRQALQLLLNFRPRRTLLLLLS